MIQRKPYKPTSNEWEDAFNMLCYHCSRFDDCSVIEGMIEMKCPEEWPSGGWVSDPGSGVTCLSYQPKKRKTLQGEELKKALSEAVPMCDGCAAQKGSDASVSLHTRRDFVVAVKTKALFTCHTEGQEGKPCGGWRRAVQGSDSGIGRAR